jgi:hypothetical protein
LKSQQSTGNEGGVLTLPGPQQGSPLLGEGPRAEGADQGLASLQIGEFTISVLAHPLQLPAYVDHLTTPVRLDLLVRSPQMGQERPILTSGQLDGDLNPISLQRVVFGQLSQDRCQAVL